MHPRNGLVLFTILLLLLTLVLSSCSSPEERSELQSSPKVASIEVQPPKPTIVVGERYILHAIARDARGNIIEQRGTAFKWYSSNPDRATPLDDGTLAGLSQGTATVKAYIGDVFGSAEITVIPQPASIELAPSSHTIAIGEQYIFRAVAKDTRGNILELPASAFKWNSSNPLYAVIDASGFVDGVSEGTAFIRAAIGDVSGGAMLKVVTKSAINVPPNTPSPTSSPITEPTPKPTPAATSLTIDSASTTVQTSGDKASYNYKGSGIVSGPPGSNFAMSVVVIDPKIGNVPLTGPQTGTGSWSLTQEPNYKSVRFERKAEEPDSFTWTISGSGIEGTSYLYPGSVIEFRVILRLNGVNVDTKTIQVKAN